MTTFSMKQLLFFKKYRIFSWVKPTRCAGIQLACLLIFLPVLIWGVLRMGKGPFGKGFHFSSAGFLEYIMSVLGKQIWSSSFQVPVYWFPCCRRIVVGSLTVLRAQEGGAGG